MFEMMDEASALKAMKEKATKLGISFNPNIGFATLSERVNKLEEELAAKEVKSNVNEEFIAKAKLAAIKLSTLNARDVTDKNLTKAQYKRKVMMRANKLIRVTVSCIDPSKKDVPGAIMGVRNGIIPLAKRFVPYDGSITHLPDILVKHLEEKTCQNFRIDIDKVSGEKIRKAKTEKMFSVQRLPQLDDKQLSMLADTQKATGSIEA